MLIHRDTLQAVSLYLYEPLQELGEPMASMLRAEGIRRTLHFHSVEALTEALLEEPPHLAILETDLHDKEMQLIARKIRMGRLGTDPFIGLIATPSEVTTRSCRNYAKAGFDYVFGKPYTPQMVLKHVRYLATKKNRFVLSRNYIGPERRSAGRLQGAERVVEVPNRLATEISRKPLDVSRYSAAVMSWRQEVNALLREMKLGA